MPIYEYACAACGHQFEEWQKMSDAPVRTCPKCKKKKVERLISRTAFQLKGGGWYSDLYSSSKPGDGKAKEEKAETKNSSDSSSDAGKTSSESATKPAAKKESKKKESTAKKAETRAA
jgi:putative FmdB family regulatory protein